MYQILHRPRRNILQQLYQRKLRHSTLSNDFQFEFITAASFMGKPVSEEELLMTKKKEKKDLVGYRGWVELTKRVWHKEYEHENKGTNSYEQKTYSGQDWWFIHEKKFGNRETYVGVADGVGGWLDEGVDPAEVAQGLMFHADQVVAEDDSTASQSTQRVLEKAYQRTIQDAQIEGGSSTALIAKLDPKLGSLQWSNLGDSSLLLVRPKEDKIIIRTQPQTHYFNCPYQLTKFPKHLKNDPKIILDTPEMAHSHTPSSSSSSFLQDGDLLFLYTDGVGDNVFPEEIVQIIKHLAKKNTSNRPFIHALAHTICRYARTVSFDRQRRSPFSIEANKHGIRNRTGGKVDDVTLTVSLILKP